MNPWILIIASLIGLILLYAALFYLASLVRQGSPFRIWLSYLGPRIRSRLSLYVPARTTEPNQRSLYPKNLESPKPEAAKPAPSPAATKPAKQPVRPVRKKSVPPASLPAMTAPSSEPLSRQVARQAAAERRRLWVKYLDEGHRQTADKLDIYRVTIGGNLHAWFCLKRKRDTLRRGRIVAWQILDETYERSPSMEQWARWATLLGLSKRLGYMFNRQP